jgi:hypothetical protein
MKKKIQTGAKRIIALINAGCQLNLMWEGV